MRLLVPVLALVAAAATSGCSTVLVAAGTKEEDVLQRGTTKAEVAEKFGPPIKVELLDDPRSEASERLCYRYVGLIKKQGNVGDTIGGNLMTLGLAELEMFPKALKESSRERVLVVWFDRSGRATTHWVADKLPPSLP